MYKVLIVDDESFIRRGLAHCMDWEAHGCELLGTANDGRQALETIAQAGADIVISDIHMENMTGLELVERLNKEYPAIKCILLTGIYEFNSVYQAIKYNVVDLVLKPTSPSRVQQAVSKAIQQIETEQQEQSMREQFVHQNDQNKRLKHAMMLSNIVDGHTPPGEVAQALDNVGLHLHHFAVITVLLWGINECTAPASFYEVEKMIYNYADQLFEDIPYYCGFTNGHSIYFVVDYPDAAPDAYQDIKHLCTDLYQTVDNLSDYNSTIGIGRLYQDPSKLPKTARESVKAANYALYDKESVPVVCVETMPAISTHTILDIKHHIDALNDAMDATDSAMAGEVLGILAQYFVDQKLSIDEVRNVCAIMVNLCIRQLWDHSLLESQVFSRDLYAEIMTCMHIEELYNLSAKAVDMTIRHLANQVQEPRNLIEQAETYIRKHYHEELSLTRIADAIHISPSYLSRVFKSKRGVSLSTYIQNVRVERAKELIVSTELRTYEIAEQVGIADPVYFSKLFKKVTGMRVRDYRDAQMEERPVQ